MVELCFSCIAVPFIVIFTLIYYILDFFGYIPDNTKKEKCHSENAEVKCEKNVKDELKDDLKDQLKDKKTN